MEMLVHGRVWLEGKCGFVLTGDAGFTVHWLNSMASLIIFGGVVVNYHDT